MASEWETATGAESLAARTIPKGEPKARSPMISNAK